MPFRRIVTLVLAAMLVMPMALAHEERPSTFPSGEGRVPPYRTSGPSLVVCKSNSMKLAADFPRKLRRYNSNLFDRCRFRHVQAAVDAVSRPGTRILVMPGTYKEQPSFARPSRACASIDHSEPLTYAEQVRCPHHDNLIAVFGDSKDEGKACDGPRCRLQIEGTGADATDVILDAGFRKLNVLRADRADGIYMRNFTVQRNPFNGIYVIETDGFVIDDVVGRWSDEYGFLTFASDHGLYKNCEAYGNGDSGIYPGSAAPHFGERFAIEITNCSSHHNLIGYSGTAGNSIHAHDNDFFENTVGVSMDSLFPNHPGLPQGYSVFENNRIYSNNANYYDYWRDGTCDQPSAERGYEDGVVCPSFGVPVGTGIMVAGGNHNLFRANDIYDNWRFGTMQFWVPAWIRGENDPELLYDTSNFNTYTTNVMGVGPDGTEDLNGIDFWWDEEGEGNCWEDNIGPESGLVSDPVALPVCDPPDPFDEGNSSKQSILFACSVWSPSNNDPPGCDWFTSPPEPTRP
jgi:hypothetical protein